MTTERSAGTNTGLAHAHGSQMHEGKLTPADDARIERLFLGVLAGTFAGCALMAVLFWLSLEYLLGGETESVRWAIALTAGHAITGALPVAAVAAWLAHRSARTDGAPAKGIPSIAAAVLVFVFLNAWWSVNRTGLSLQGWLWFGTAMAGAVASFIVPIE